MCLVDINNCWSRDRILLKEFVCGNHVIEFWYHTTGHLAMRKDYNYLHLIKVRNICACRDLLVQWNL